MNLGRVDAGRERHDVAPHLPSPSRLLPARCCRPVSPNPLIVNSIWPWPPRRRRASALAVANAKVVVAMGGKDQHPRRPAFRDQPPDQTRRLHGGGVADGVGNVDRGGAGADGVSTTRLRLVPTPSGSRPSATHCTLSHRLRACVTVLVDAVGPSASNRQVRDRAVAAAEVPMKVWMRGLFRVLHRLPSSGRCRLRLARARPQ